MVTLKSAKNHEVDAIIIRLSMIQEHISLGHNFGLSSQVFGVQGIVGSLKSLESHFVELNIALYIIISMAII